MKSGNSEWTTIRIRRKDKELLDSLLPTQSCGNTLTVLIDLVCYNPTTQGIFSKELTQRIESIRDTQAPTNINVD